MATKVIVTMWVITFLWFMKKIYEKEWNEEIEETKKYMDFSFKLSNDNLILIEKNLNLKKENKKLKKELNKSKNRVAKVIKEEETNGQYRNK